MKFGCMSCGAKYSVPDQRLHTAGSAGLRVRCSRCRAIMVVAETARALHEPESDAPPPRTARFSDDEDTRKELRSPHPRRVVRAPEIMATSGDGPAVTTTPPVDSPGVPAALSASGVFRPLPGVHRQVTGLFFPELEQLKGEAKTSGSRVWYAAIDNRPRGPFSATEMLQLAEKGKLRDSTLVWRPGFSTWKKIRHGEAGTAEDLTWLRKVVLARKLREMDAQERARDRLGIQPVKIARTSSGAPRAAWAALPGMPPLPPEELDDADSADVRAPTGAASLAAGLATSTTAAHGADVIPFAWRADELPRLERRRSWARRLLFGVVTAAGVVVAGTVMTALIVWLASWVSADPSVINP